MPNDSSEQIEPIDTFGNGLLVTLFLASSVLINLCVLRAGSQLGQVVTFLSLSNESVLALMVGLGMGQLAMLVTWTVYGRVSPLVRVGGLLGGSVFLALTIASLSKNDTDMWLAQIGLFNLIWGSVLATLRLAGLRCDRLHESVYSSWDESRQFSLATLFGCTTSAAFVFGVFRLAEFPWQFTLQLIIYCSGYAIVALLSLLAVLTSRGGFAATLLAIIFSALIGAVTAIPENRLAMNALICTSQAMFVCSAALVGRISRYQMQYQKSMVGR